MKRVFEKLYTLPERTILIIGFLMVALLGVIDYFSGYEMSFAIFYLLPVMFIGWFSERGYAIAVSILSGVVWYIADILSGHLYSHPILPVWNAIMRLGFFLLIVFSLSEIKRLLVSEQNLARIDFLTGISNSRNFIENAKKEIERSARFSHPFTLAYVDIDNFKKVNDSLGHAEGDELLQVVAQTIKDHIRSVDMAARLGGDEFAILLLETNEKDANSTMVKIQTELLEVVKQHNWPVSFSMGAVTSHEKCNLDDLIKEADNLMYIVKDRGKNSIAYKTFSVLNKEAVSY
ncbi:MAG TPA: GGDEF domain-containing protein [Sulfurovum sp.]